MSGLFGGTSKQTPGQINIPAFTSSGGITPQQQALGQYSYGQDLDAQANLFGSSGTGMSTMATQGAEGAKNTEAEQMAQMSDTNQGAQYEQYQNQLQGFQQNLSNELAIGQANQGAATNTANSLDQLAGFNAGATPSTGSS